MQKLKKYLKNKKKYMENNTAYIFDLEAIMDFVLKSDNTRISNSEITEMYMQDEDTEEMVLTSKQLRELKNNGDSSECTLKYDLIKSFITILDEAEIDNVNELGFLQKMTFNTMLTKGLIKTINVE